MVEGETSRARAGVNGAGATGAIAGQKAGAGRLCAVVHTSAGGAGSGVRAGGCGLPELDLEGKERVEEVGADEARSESIAVATTARSGGGG